MFGLIGWRPPRREFLAVAPCLRGNRQSWGLSQLFQIQALLRSSPILMSDAEIGFKVASLKSRLDLHQIAGGICAVNNPVVIAKGQVDH